MPFSCTTGSGVAIETGSTATGAGASSTAATGAASAAGGASTGADSIATAVAGSECSRPANLRIVRVGSTTGVAASATPAGIAATCARSARPASMNTARHLGQRTLSGLTGTFSSGRKYFEEQSDTE